MSHFTVLVIGKEPEEQLAPFHEFESTGDDNEFVQDVDQTEDLKSAWNSVTNTATRLKDPSGKLHEPYNDEFYREPTDAEIKKAGPLGMMGSGFSSDISYTSKDWKDGKGYRAKVRFIPEGFQEIEIPYKEVMTFTQYVLEYEGKTALKPRQKKTDDHKYGYALLDKDGEVVKVIDRTNPNRKWDWYQLGGRWTGFFKLKNAEGLGGKIPFQTISALAQQYETTTLVVETLVELVKDGDFNKLSEYNRKNPVKGGYYLEKDIKALITLEYENATVGESGLGTGIPKNGYVDSALIKDIDFKGMIAEAGQKARKRYEDVERLMGGSIPKLEFIWKDMIAENGKFSHLGIQEKRGMYHNQPAKTAVDEARKNPRLTEDEKSLLTWLELDEYQVPIEEYVKRFENSALSTFAVLKDGKWHERGEMGWWGAVSDEKDRDEWNAQFTKLLMDLPGETMISVYDCHI